MKAIGVDMIEVERIAGVIARKGDRFLQRVYTAQELAHCAGRVPSLAARWAAKEAVGKAFGTGIGDVAFREIEVVCDSRGQPTIVLHGEAAQLARRLDWRRIALSLSHTRQHAIAFVVIE